MSIGSSKNTFMTKCVDVSAHEHTSTYMTICVCTMLVAYMYSKVNISRSISLCTHPDKSKHVNVNGNTIY